MLSSQEIAHAVGQGGLSQVNSNVETLPIGSAGVGTEMSLLDLVLGSGLVVQGVLILLVVMSIWTWGIALSKYFQLKRSRSQSAKFNNIFWSSSNLQEMDDSSRRLADSPVVSVFSAGFKELKQQVGNEESDQSGDIESVDRALRRAKAEELTRLEKGTTFLATTASAAPFIGLFGTVWGIMNAFIGLSQVKTSSIQAVAPGISEALIATAIGLAAAIPAAIAYNYFTQQLRVLARDMDMFSAQFLNMARRNFVK